MPLPAAPNGSLWLIAPDTAGYDTIARREQPFALWPVGPQPLLELWIAEAVRRNLGSVHVVADAPTGELRGVLARGPYWSRTLHLESSCPPGVEPEIVDHLPGQEVPPCPQEGAALLSRWLELNLAWLRLPRDESLSVELPGPGGSWVHPKATVHPRAVLTGPCWIGEATQVEAAARIGPGACIGAGCTVEGGTEIIDSVVLPGTFVGGGLHLSRRIADGPVLLDPDKGVRAEITDRFILSRAAGSPLSELLPKVIRNWIGGDQR